MENCLDLFIILNCMHISNNSKNKSQLKIYNNLWNYSLMHASKNWRIELFWAFETIARNIVFRWKIQTFVECKRKGFNERISIMRRWPRSRPTIYIQINIGACLMASLHTAGPNEKCELFSCLLCSWCLADNVYWDHSRWRLRDFPLTINPFPSFRALEMKFWRFS